LVRLWLNLDYCSLLNLAHPESKPRKLDFQINDVLAILATNECSMSIPLQQRDEKRGNPFSDAEKSWPVGLEGFF